MGLPKAADPRSDGTSAWRQGRQRERRSTERLGRRARATAAASGGQPATNGLAIAGIVLGWIGIGFLALFMLIQMIGLASSPA